MALSKQDTFGGRENVEEDILSVPDELGSSVPATISISNTYNSHKGVASERFVD